MQVIFSLEYQLSLLICMQETQPSKQGVFKDSFQGNGAAWDFTSDQTDHVDSNYGKSSSYLQIPIGSFK